MGYIGQQIVAHTDMLAELQAIRGANVPQLQQLVAQVEQETRQHLEMVQGIAKQIEGREDNEAGRPAQERRV